MSDISYYFDKDFIDESGLFQNQQNFDKSVFILRSSNNRIILFIEFQLN